MPETASGAFTRGGAIFIALLFNSFQVSFASFFVSSHFPLASLNALYSLSKALN